MITVPLSYSVSIPPELAGLRLDVALSHLLPQLSRGQIHQLFVSGQLPGKASDKARAGALYKVIDNPAPSQDQPQDIALSVVFEDDHLLVVDKPAGLVVHPGAGNLDGTLVNALLAHHPKSQLLPRAGVVHRLDKDTSGLLVVSKTEAVRLRLVEALALRQIERHYWALAWGLMSGEGDINQPLGRHRQHRTRMAVVPQGRPAQTFYRVLHSSSVASELALKLATGRTHQIRVHMAFIGHPLVGDATYGRSPSQVPAQLQHCHRQALHACQLAFDHPISGEALHFTSEVPALLRQWADTALQTHDRGAE